MPGSRWDCRACEHELERTGLPVVCEIHASSAPKNISQIDDVLTAVETIYANNKQRARLLEIACLRVESWKKGIIKA